MGKAPRPASGGSASKRTASNGSAKSKKSARKSPSLAEDESSSSSSSSDAGDDSDEYDDAVASQEEEEEAEAEAEEEEESAVDSDDIDASDFEERDFKKSSKKRAGSLSGGRGSATKSSKKARKSGDDDLNLRRVEEKFAKHPGPRTNPETSLILPSTLDFLGELRKPEHNDREWFAAHDAWYRHALKNFNAFASALVPRAMKADRTLPLLPPKDLAYRIYRDVRFSRDKTPYKTAMGLSYSRTGRKGPWAGYYLHIKPGGTMVGGGRWCPEKNELATLRQQIIRDSRPLRSVLSAPKFVEFFGEARPKGPGVRSNVFGYEDELKNCPKIEGVDKKHPEIDLLKLRSFVVGRNFSDEVVLAPDFLDKVTETIEVLAPFIRCLNEIAVPGSHADSSDEEDEEEEDDDEEEGGEEEEQEEGDEARSDEEEEGNED